MHTYYSRHWPIAALWRQRLASVSLQRHAGNCKFQRNDFAKSERKRAEDTHVSKGDIDVIQFKTLLSHRKLSAMCVSALPYLHRMLKHTIYTYMPIVNSDRQIDRNWVGFPEQLAVPNNPTTLTPHRSKLNNARFSAQSACHGSYFFSTHRQFCRKFHVDQIHLWHSTYSCVCFQLKMLDFD